MESFNSNDFKCKVCDFEAKTLGALKQHNIKLHKLQCSICLTRFTSQEELRKHSKEHRKAKHCNICDKTVANISMHVRKVHGCEKNFQCEICDYAFYSQKELTEHIEGIHSKEKQLKNCDQCDKSFKNSFSLKYHYITTHFKDNPGFPCDKCDYVAKHNMNLKTHVSNIHSKSSYSLKSGKCELCDQIFKNLNLHVKQVHKDKPVKCNICEKSMTRPQLKYHMAGVHSIATNGETWLNCNICDKSFLGKRQLQAHYKNIHLEKKKISCEYELCEHLANCRYKLKKHVEAVHLKLKPFKCEVCGKTFNRKMHLESHRSVHSDTVKYKFVCEFCDFKSNHNTNFKNHINAVHLGKRTYTCDTCDKAFTQKSHVRTHIKNVHLNSKPFLCKFCDKRFASSQAANIHEKGVHNDFDCDPEFSCDICQFKSHYRDSLKKHKKAKHENSSK